jgi:hypothetical protein
LDVWNVCLGRGLGVLPRPLSRAKASPLNIDQPLSAGALAGWPAATRFRDLAFDRCHAFLPDQEGTGGWCCGQPVKGGKGLLAKSYCAQHCALFRVALRRRP